MKSHRLLIAAALASLALAVPAKAQLATGSEFATQTPGKNVVGVVEMCLNPSNQAVPCTGAAAPAPGYSTLATPVASAASGTTGPISTSIPAGGAGKTSYVCGFDVSAIGGTDPITVTVAGLKGATTFTYRMSSSAGGVFLTRTFTPCVPANAANAAITVATTAAAAATGVNVNAFGYQQ